MSENMIQDQNNLSAEEQQALLDKNFKRGQFWPLSVLPATFSSLSLNTLQALWATAPL